MPLTTAMAVLPALLGAFCFATGAALQQHSAVHATADGTASPRLLWQLAQRPVWLAGVGAAVVGVALHLFALTQGPLTLVQPLGVTGVLFAIPLAAVLRGHRIRLWELLAALVVIGGLSMLLSVIPIGPGATRVHPVRAIAFLASAVMVTTALGSASGRVRRRWQPPLFLAAGAGVAFGTTSALVRIIIRVAGQPGQAMPIVIAGVGIAILAPLGFLLMQGAYRAGGLTVALAILTVLDPVTAATGGVWLLHEPFPSAPLPATVTAIGAALATLGIAVLSRSPAHALAPAPTGAEAVGHTSRAEPSNAEQSLTILLGADTYAPDVNGAARFTYCLATGLAARGHDVHVVCPSAHGSAATFPAEGVTVHRLRSVRTPLHPTFRVCLPLLVDADVRDLIRRVQPDVVHVQGHFLIGRALLRTATHRQVKVVATNHFMPDNLVTYAHIPHALRAAVCALGWRDFARVFSKADVVTTPTPIAAQLIRQKGLCQPIHAVSCGVDLGRFGPRVAGESARKRLGLPDQPTLLFVGRLDEEKRLHDLVAALPEVRRRTEAQVVLAGTGTQRAKLVALARRLGVADHVRFLGFVPDPELPLVYQAADVFCMPGIAELQSIVTLEAMASGLPVIAADALALPHLVHPDVNGYLYQPGDVATLATRAVTVLTSRPTRLRMGAASQELVARHDQDNTFTWFEDLYGSLAGTRRQLLAS